jgi:hypothetical protein
VRIESVQPWSMNVACAGTVLLYDRHIKRAVPDPPSRES